ncbi:MAG: S8 family serine peptidase [Lachnospiraceae bacterium]|nr:S8 family serine peptidase [Lachnospiraceae bacterium]
MKIAIVDDGINDFILNLSDKVTKLMVTSEGAVVSDTTKYEKMTHGTICCGIIDKYAKDATYVSIKILDLISKRGDVEGLYVALKWCLRNNIKLINLSLGTLHKGVSKINEIITLLAQNSSYIVAACNNEGLCSFPSSLFWVLSVANTNKVSNGEFFMNKCYDDFEKIKANGKQSFVTREGKRFVSNGSNSFAAPVVTACVYNILNKNNKLTWKQLLHCLENNSTNKDKMVYMFNFNSVKWIYMSSTRNMHRVCGEKILDKGRNSMVNIALTKESDISKLEDVKKCADKIGAISYLGTLSPQNINKLRSDFDSLLWDEKIYLRLLKEKTQNVGSCETPILGVRNNIPHKDFLLQKLMLELKRKGYNFLIISEEKYAYTKGEVYLPKEVGIAQIAQLYYKNYMYDGVIYLQDSIYDCEEVDYYVDVENRKIISDDTDLFCKRIINDFELLF